MKVAVPFLAGICALVAAALVPAGDFLCIAPRKASGAAYVSRLALQGFEISYTHSVNKGRVRDTYACAGRGLVLDKTEFVSYGAGIPESYETEGASFFSDGSTYGIRGLNRRLPRLYMAVGVVAGHALKIQGGELPFSSLFEPGTGIIIEVRSVSLLAYALKYKKIDPLLNGGQNEVR